MYTLSKNEIDLIAIAIEVAQFEGMLPEATDSTELKDLLDKLGIRYDSLGHAIPCE